MYWNSLGLPLKCQKKKKETGFCHWETAVLYNLAKVVIMNEILKQWEDVELLDIVFALRHLKQPLKLY